MGDVKGLFSADSLAGYAKAVGREVRADEIQAVLNELMDANGDVIAEVVDDHVEASDLRAGVDRSWREWEVELGPAAPTERAERDAFFAAASDLAFAAGARPASSPSKLARALGH